MEYGTATERAVQPKSDTVSELLDSITLRAREIERGTEHLADSISGSRMETVGDETKAPSPLDLMSRLRQVRLILDDAEKNIHRAANGLGQKK